MDTDSTNNRYYSTAWFVSMLNTTESSGYNIARYRKPGCNYASVKNSIFHSSWF